MHVEYTDMLWLAVSLFTNAALSSGLLTKFNPATADGKTSVHRAEYRRMVGQHGGCHERQTHGAVRVVSFCLLLYLRSTAM
jgi:hypothetical protein